MIHGLQDAELALEAARRAQRGAIVLLSAPDAACFLGAAWWRALIARAALLHPDIPRDDLLDCGDAAGRAMEALRLGQRGLILLPACPQREAVLERARPLGATVLLVRPAALDLADRDAPRRLDAWLGA